MVTELDLINSLSTLVSNILSKGKLTDSSSFDYKASNTQTDIMLDIETYNHLI